MWDRRFVELAKLVSGWSKDPSARVGCVVVRDRRIVSTGYNGFPPGVADDHRLHDREQKYPRVVHAEMNALLQGPDVRGATLYVWWTNGGGTPCSNCAKHIVAAGIRRVVVTRLEADCDRWRADCSLGREIMEEAGILVEEVGDV